MVKIQNTIKAPKCFPEIWQPIASAPRDGTFVLTKSGSWQPCITHFANYDGRTRWGSSPEGFVTEEEFLRYWHEVSYDPTEWMPLPEDDVADAIETAYRNGFIDGERHAGEAKNITPETQTERDQPTPAEYLQDAMENGGILYGPGVGRPLGLLNQSTSKRDRQRIQSAFKKGVKEGRRIERELNATQAQSDNSDE